MNTLTQTTGLCRNITLLFLLTFSSFCLAYNEVVSDSPQDGVRNLDVTKFGHVGPLPTAPQQLAFETVALDGTSYTTIRVAGACGDASSVATGGGIEIVDVSNPNKPMLKMAEIPAQLGQSTQDVDVANLNSGRVLVQASSQCDSVTPTPGGGFELYNIDDPHNPVLITHQNVTPINSLINFEPAQLSTVRLALFTQGTKDYLAVITAAFLGRLQLFDITNPASPQFVGTWGTESIDFPAVDFVNTNKFQELFDGAVWVNSTGQGDVQNSFIYDVAISNDGQHAYLAASDQGVVLLDISDPSSPTFISQAVEPTQGDGEISSFRVAVNDDETIVVDTESDVFVKAQGMITSGPNTGHVFSGAEFSFTNPLNIQANATFSGGTRFVGRGCDIDPPVPSAAGKEIAVVLRGTCRFDEKATNIIDQGYQAMIVVNSNDTFISGNGDRHTLVGMMIGLTDGSTIMNDDLFTLGAVGRNVTLSALPYEWGGARIWDFSDANSPSLLSSFDTSCSANGVIPDPSCTQTQLLTTATELSTRYHPNNLNIDSLRQQTYFAWGTNGVIVIDIKDPANPVEIARFNPRTSADFIAENGGDQFSVGISLIPGENWIYQSDAVGGFYVLKESGEKSKRAGKKN